MAGSKKVTGLLFCPDRTLQWPKLTVDGLYAIDEKGKRAWYLLPQILRPLRQVKIGRVKVIRQVLPVTEISAMPLGLEGTGFFVPKTWRFLTALTKVSTKAYNDIKEPGHHWLGIGIAMMCATLAILGLVVLLSSDSIDLSKVFG